MLLIVSLLDCGKDITMHHDANSVLQSIKLVDNVNEIFMFE